jgi:glucose/arabinose dehydrogenase
MYPAVTTGMPETPNRPVPSNVKQHSPAAIKLVSAFPHLQFSLPLDLQRPEDGINHWYVVEQGGLIKRFAADSSTRSSSTVLDLSKKISRNGWEMGLLGMAFHPHFRANGKLYVNYTTENPRRTVIAEYRMKPDQSYQAEETTARVILTFEQPYSNHNGGGLVFGPDGFLYIGTGDGGSAGDPQGNGQNRKTLLGKMLRIDIDKSGKNRNYAIPPDNPFVGNRDGFREEIFAWGLRNPWRYSFDSRGQLWVGDVGQDKWEEIDIVEKGKNYGWGIMEGPDCFNPSRGCDQTKLELPIISYPHPIGASVTGGIVYTGSACPSLKGGYVYADFMTGRIWIAWQENGKVEVHDLLESEMQISSFGIDQQGELYLCSFDGYIYRIAER